MSTKISTQQLLAFATKARLVTQAQADFMAKWAPVDPDTLTGRPDLVQQCLAAQRDLERLVQHPHVQAAIQPAPPAQAQVNQAQVAQVRRAELHQANSNQPLYDSGLLQAPPVQRSHTYNQQAQPVVTRGPGGYVYFDATPKHRFSQQLQPPAGAYAVDPQHDLTTKALIQNVERELQQLPAKIAAALQQAQSPKKVTKSQANLTPAQRTAARLMAQVQRSKAAPAPVSKAQTQQPVQPPQLPISPVTGQPSTITAAVRATTMGERNPTAGLHPYQVEQQRQYQAAQQRAAHDAALPISPVTGQPSSITAAIRKTTL